MVQQHIADACPNRNVQCPKCEVVVLDKDMRVHQETDCPEELTQCQMCHETIIRKFVFDGSHALSCQPVVLRRPCLRCGQHIEVRRQSVHDNDLCPERIVTCVLCKQDVTSKDLQQHKDMFCPARVMPIAVCHFEEPDEEAVYSVEIPPDFICPISGFEVMEDPVVTADGQSYDRHNIQRWLEVCAREGRAPTSPLTGLQLETTTLTTNIALHKAIQDLLPKLTEVKQQHRMDENFHKGFDKRADKAKWDKADMAANVHKGDKADKKPLFRRTEVLRVLGCGISPPLQASTWQYCSTRLFSLGATVDTETIARMQWACDILDVHGDCTDRDIKNSRDRLAKLFHPDKTSRHAEEQECASAMMAVNEANKELCQNHRVRAYMNEQRMFDNQRKTTSSAFYAYRFADAERRKEMKRNRQETTSVLQQCLMQPLEHINLNYLQITLADAERCQVHFQVLKRGDELLKKAKNKQRRLRCEMEGGPDLSTRIVMGRACRFCPATYIEEFFEIAICNCNCRQDHQWTVQCAGNTGQEPFGAQTRVTSVLGDDGSYAGTSFDATRRAEEEYRRVTGLGITESTQPPQQRPRQWSSSGRQFTLGCLPGDGAGCELPVWQFYLDAPLDGYQPAWHNYLPNPKTGEDASRTVEKCHWEHSCYQDQRKRNAVDEMPSMPPSPFPKLAEPLKLDTSRSIQSGGHQYKVDFNTGNVDTPMTQTNIQTAKVRPIRFVKAIEQCQCSKCVRPSQQKKEEPPPLVAEQPKEEPIIPIEVPCCAKITDMVQNGPLEHPSFWRGLPPDQFLVDIPLDASETVMVRDQFLSNFGAPGERAQKMLEIKSVQRIENQLVYQQYWQEGLHDGKAKEECIMFHGCKTEANQTSIIKNGFQTKFGRSGIYGASRKDGTWFAYISSYSDGGGYVWVDSDGWRHIFVCLVLKAKALKDNPTMRVVGQDRAYPQWLLTYKLKPRI